MIDLQRDGNIFTLTMNAGENRWNTTFVRAFSDALDEIEGSRGPAALITTSANEKFFSNGLDLDWVAKATEQPDHPGGDRKAFGPEFMTVMSRIITLSIPSIAAINGHGFGAGFMTAMCHDVRIMREDRGFVCANEMQLGMRIPPPELALFRHKLPANVFFESVQLARRWTGRPPWQQVLCNRRQARTSSWMWHGLARKNWRRWVQTEKCSKHRKKACTAKTRLSTKYTVLPGCCATATNTDTSRRLKK